MAGKKLKVVFIGCVALSLEILEDLLTLSSAEVVGIASREKSDFHSDFASLLPLARERGIAHWVLKNNKQDELAQWIRSLSADVVYCFGWPYLLKQEVLSSTRLGVVGYHPAALPQNRGRHPLIWAIALGLQKTASTFFFMDTGADSGPILSQVPLEIGQKDAGELYRELGPICRKQVREFTPLLLSGKYKTAPQDHSIANTWRRRSMEDGKIDWRMSATAIHNLVRALARPYVGAHTRFGRHECKIWKTAPLSGAPQNAEPGKVLESSPTRFVVKCGDGAISILEHNFPELPEEGMYL